MRAGWLLMVVATGCGAGTSGPDVPLARDCSAPAAALDLCDVADRGCQQRVFDAVSCFADVDPSEAPPVSWAGSAEDYRGAFLPAVILEPPMIEALVIAHAQGATRAVDGRLAQVQPRVSAHEGPLRVIVPGTLPEAPWARIHTVAEGFGLALQLRELPRAEWLAASRDDLDARLGIHAMLAGRATLWARFAALAVLDSALGVGSATIFEDAFVIGTLGWNEDLRNVGDGAVSQTFVSGGDPGVAALMALAPTRRELARRWERTIAEQRAARPPPLEVDRLRVPDGHTVRASFAGGEPFAQMLEAYVEMARDRVALVDTPSGPVVVWAVEGARGLDGWDRALRARDAPVVHLVEEPWQVLVIGTSSTAEQLAHVVMEGLR